MLWPRLLAPREGASLQFTLRRAFRIKHLRELTMDNSTPVFWIWIAAVVLFAVAATVACYFARKAWRRAAKRDGST
jgi:hypothetical protein